MAAVVVVVWTEVLLAPLVHRPLLKQVEAQA